jgi:hypothetical protein
MLLLLAATLVAAAVVAAALLIRQAVNTATSVVSNLVREQAGGVEPERIEVVSPEAINEKWIEMHGEPNDGQLTIGPELQTQAREGEYRLDGFVPVG